MSSLKVHMRQFALTRGWVWALLAALSVTDARAQSAAEASNVAERCNVLGSADLSMLQDAPTQILGTKLMPPGDALPGYCEVSGYVAPSFGFLLQLPSDNWNGKLIQHGCGGACGSFLFEARCQDALRRGYACIRSDGGHKSTPFDLKWSFNRPQAQIDYWTHTSHVTALASKAIVERYYSNAPRKSYFMGCSSGGIQGLFAAQRFPWDFDGILLLGPALNPTGVFTNLLWNHRALTSRNGEPLLGSGDVELLHKAAVAKCDLDDGIKDGVIGDPARCDFQPAALRCPSGQQERCLTTQQVEAVQKVYDGPVTSKGEQITLPIAVKGSEMSWPLWYGATFGNFAAEMFRYFYIQPNPGPAWNPKDFNFDSDYKRFSMESAIDPLNPDLRRFKAAGGKLLMATGGADAIEGVPRTVDYYESAERVVGSRAATQEFFRLFVVPGVGHCGGGDGPFAVDYVSYLESWVEKGEAPDRLIGSHIKVDRPSQSDFPFEFPLNPAKIEFSRPIYPYPIKAKYLGRGDPKDASSFGPVEPSSTKKRMK